MQGLLSDLRYSVRVLLKAKGFAAAAILILALGIGANSAIFSVVNAVLLRPLPFADSDRLVELYHVPPARSFPGTTQFAVSPANYLDWRSTAKSFDGMAAYAPRQRALTGGDRAETVQVTMAGGDFFSLMRATPEIGRLLNDNDDQSGRGDVAVISHSLWQNHFGSNPHVLGQKLMLDGEAYTIVGVAQSKLSFAAWQPSAADAWTPLGWDDKTRAVRNNHNYLVAARLKPGVAVSQAQAEMNTISKQLEAAYPEEDRDWGAVIDPLREELVGNMRPILLVLLGAVGFVLLIACANVANLITARNLARRKEFAVRAALGASRGRALQQMLCESVLLSVAGGLAGLGLAALATPMLVTYVNRQFNVGTAIPLDQPVILFTLGISVLTGILTGAIPAWRGMNADLNEVIKQSAGRSGSDAGARTMRNVLVTAEVALSLMLLAGAGLMVRSIWLLTEVDPGFDPKNVITAIASIPSKEYQDPRRIAEFYRQAIDRVRALPGVESAGMIDSLPFRGGSAQPFVIEGQPAGLFAQQPTVAVRGITPGYLHAMRIPLVHGRDFADSDSFDSAHVVLISEAMARKFFPGVDPVGKRLTLSFVPDKICEVVGVVGDVKQSGLDKLVPAPTLYTAHTQAGNWPMTIVARTSITPEGLIAPLTADFAKFEPNQPLRRIRMMQEVLDSTMTDRRTSMWLLSSFAALALLLAAVGLHSVLAYMVRRRVREIGIRMALGAKVGDVLRMVILDGLKPTVAGIVIGLTGAFLLSSYLKSLVYGIRTNDPYTFAAVTFVLAIVSLIASVVPAWRATRVDPIQVLRDE
jgi:putative ABC transport system permease protein